MKYHHYGKYGGCDDLYILLPSCSLSPFHLDSTMHRYPYHHTQWTCAELCLQQATLLWSCILGSLAVEINMAYHNEPQNECSLTLHDRLIQKCLNFPTLSKTQMFQTKNFKHSLKKLAICSLLWLIYRMLCWTNQYLHGIGINKSNFNKRSQWMLMYNWRILSKNVAKETSDILKVNLDKEPMDKQNFWILQ